MRAREWSPTAAAFIDVIGSEKRSPAGRRERCGSPAWLAACAASFPRSFQSSSCSRSSACGGSKTRRGEAGPPGATARPVAGEDGAASRSLIGGAIAGQHGRVERDGRCRSPSGARTSTSSCPAAGCRRSRPRRPVHVHERERRAALSDPSVKPWTKLDTRRLAADSGRPARRARPRPRRRLPRRRRRQARTRRRDRRRRDRRISAARVDPARVVARAPAAQRAAIGTRSRNDYLAKPFPADFWLDDAGRVRRVLVDYRHGRRRRIVLDATFSDFGVEVDRTLPAANKIQDITPKSRSSGTVEPGTRLLAPWQRSANGARHRC